MKELRALSIARPLLAAALAAALAAPAGAANVDQRFIAAMQLYHGGRFAAAYGRLIELADAGHADAARMALLMLRHGPVLHLGQWSASRGQIRRWLDLASQRQPAPAAEAGD